MEQKQHFGTFWKIIVFLVTGLQSILILKGKHSFQKLHFTSLTSKMMNLWYVQYKLAS